MNTISPTLAFEGSLNPFEDNIVSEPRHAPRSVVGLNDGALRALVDAFVALETAHATKPPVRSPKARLIVSPDRGYGKTHLLGRLFETLGARASTIYLTPFQDPEKPWHSILRMTVDELVRPLEGETCQLHRLAIGVLARLGADFMSPTEFPDYPDVDKAQKILRRLAANPTIGADDKPWVDWLTTSGMLSGLLRRLRQAHLMLDGRENAWIRLFAKVASEPRHGEAWSAAVKWLRAEPLEPNEVERLGLDVADNEGRGDSSPREVNDLCYKRMHALCAIASFHRPFVFCFDQTEFFVGDELLIRAFGNCIWQLVDNMPNHLTIATANQSSWLDGIKPYMAAANQDRFSEAPITLKGVGREVASQVLRARLEAADVAETLIAAFFAQNWLEQQFVAVDEMGVRALLTRAAERFRDLAKKPKQEPVTLEGLFDKELATFRDNPALQRHDPDSLLWFVKDLGPALPDAKVEHTTGAKHFPLQWRWAGRRVLFAFEGGDNHLRWNAIAREASALATMDTGAFAALALRSPDLPSIPRATWKTVAATMATAQAAGFRVVNLTSDRLCEMLAARELQANALQGNIDFDGPQTLDWLRKRFALFLGELASAPKPVDPTPDPVEDDLEPDHERAALALAREKKLVDITVVLALIGGEPRRAALLRFCEIHPNLKAFPGPQSTWLQWRHTP